MEDVSESFPKGRITKQHSIVKESLMRSCHVPEEVILHDQSTSHNGTMDESTSLKHIRYYTNTYVDYKSREVIRCYNGIIGGSKSCAPTLTYKDKLAECKSSEQVTVNEDTERKYNVGDEKSHRYPPDRGRHWPHGRQDDFLRLYEHAYAAYNGHDDKTDKI